VGRSEKEISKTATSPFPLHGWEFDPCTGKDAYNPARGVESFPVEEREDGVYVGI